MEKNSKEPILRAVITSAIMFGTITGAAYVFEDEEPRPSQTTDATATRDTELILGERISLRCIACHDISGHQNKIGPHLSKIVGRKSAAVGDYQYSEAMKSANIVWDESTLIKFLAEPQSVVPGTTMGISPLSQPESESLLKYLQSKQE